MARVMHHRLAVLGEGEAAIEIAVLPKRAGYRHEAIAQQPVLQTAG